MHYAAAGSAGQPKRRQTAPEPCSSLAARMPCPWLPACRARHPQRMPCFGLPCFAPQGRQGPALRAYPAQIWSLSQSPETQSTRVRRDSGSAAACVDPEHPKGRWTQSQGNASSRGCRALQGFGSRPASWAGALPAKPAGSKQIGARPPVRRGGRRQPKPRSRAPQGRPGAAGLDPLCVSGPSPPAVQRQDAAATLLGVPGDSRAGPRPDPEGWSRGSIPW